MTPIERAARALCHGDPDQIIQPAHQAEPKSAAARPLWHTYVPAVCTVIAAIREPSEAMNAAWRGSGHDSVTAKRDWYVMIDALLADTP